MKRVITGSLLTIALIGFSLMNTAMQTGIVPGGGQFLLVGVDQAVYQGVAKCKTCHKKVKQGEQYGIWQKTAHAKAFDTLAGEKAREYATAAGVDDPQADPACLKCHVTAFDVAPEFLGKKYKIEDGVGCESCHGPGQNYYKKKIMISIVKGDTTPESVGLIIPEEETCLTCHNDKSPAFKGFDFEDAMAKIAHPIPEETKAELLEGK